MVLSKSLRFLLNFKFNLFSFLIDDLEMFLSYLAVTRTTRGYIIAILRATLDHLVVIQIE